MRHGWAEAIGGFLVQIAAQIGGGEATTATPRCVATQVEGGRLHDQRRARLPLARRQNERKVARGERHARSRHSTDGWNFSR